MPLKISGAKIIEEEERLSAKIISLGQSSTAPNH
jgi:hypothetical protein